MRFGKSCGFFCAVFWVVVLSAGCSSSSDGGSTNNDSSGYQTYTAPGSDLVLRIPDTLEVLQEDIEDIHHLADMAPHCYTTNGGSIDIVLAQACIYYDQYYLYPQYFPSGLNNITNVKAYVEYFQINDRFTYYFSPEDFMDIMLWYHGDTTSIGFSIEYNGQTVTAQNPPIINGIDPFTRAWIDGFQIGDKLMEIDGKSIVGMNRDAVDLLFPTNEGETVEITVDRNGVEIAIDTAAEDNICLLIDQDIAYLNARTFTQKTGEEIRLGYDELKQKAGGQIDKLILDLRHNVGGAISGSLVLVDYLINNDNGTSPMFSISGPGFDDETYYLGEYTEFNIGDFEKTNFVLLIDENSASASEIVAAVLKHYGTATLIGETTFGKGIGESIVELIDGSGVAIPSLNGLPPSGESYHNIGILPDYPLNAYPSSFDDDPVLAAAIEYLNTGDITIAASDQTARKSDKSFAAKSIDPLKEKLHKTHRNGHY